MRIFKELKLMPEEEIIYKTYTLPIALSFFIAYIALTYYFFYYFQDTVLIGYFLWKTPIITGLLIIAFIQASPIYEYIITNKRIIIRHYSSCIVKNFRDGHSILYQDISEIKELKLFGRIKAGFIYIKYKNNRFLPYFGAVINPAKFVLQAKQQLEIYSNYENIQEDITKSKSIIFTRKLLFNFILCFIVIYVVLIASIFKFPVLHKKIVYNSDLLLAKVTFYFNPNDSLAYNYLGSAYRDIGKYDEAVKNYTYAIRLNPHNIFFYRNLAYTYHVNKQYDPEISILKEAFKNNNIYTFVLANIAEAYKLKGNYKLAIEYYKKAIKLSPEIPNSYAGLGILYKDIGNYKESEKIFRKVSMFSDKQLSNRCLNPNALRKNLITIHEAQDKNKGTEYLKKHFIEDVYKYSHY